MARITHGYIPSETDLFAIKDFRELTRWRLEKMPTVPMFSYTDYATGVKTKVLPDELERDRDALGVFLHEQGLQRDHIAIIAPNSYKWILALHAIVCSDNVAVMLDYTLEEPKLLELAKDSDAKAVFAGSRLLDTANKINELTGAKVFNIDEIFEYVEAGKRMIAEGKDEGTKLELNTDACSFISYTSGTTGRSKGVMLSQKNIISNALQFHQNADFGGDEVCMVPLNHLLGVGVCQNCTLLSGYTFHLNQNIRYLHRDYAENNPKTLIVVPLLVRNMIDVLWKNIRRNGREKEVRALIEQNAANNIPYAERRKMFAEDLSIFGTKLSLIVCGGAPLPVELYEQCGEFGIHLLEGYGITECSPVLSVNRDVLCKIGSVGRIIPGEEILIDKPDADGVGEICVKGPQVMLGYYKMEEATAEVMEGGWFHTGDLGYMDEDYYIFITGRIKNLIILSNGENVSPEELENLISDCPAVQEVIVYEKGDYIAAMIFPNEEVVAEKGIAETQRIAREFIKELNENLTIYKRIRYVDFRSTPFERTPLKKIKRTHIQD